MAVSPFHRLSHANCRVSLKRKALAQQHVSTRRRKNLASAKTAAPRTRGSVPRASGFVQIPITLISIRPLATPILCAERDGPRHPQLGGVLCAKKAFFPPPSTRIFPLASLRRGGRRQMEVRSTYQRVYRLVYHSSRYCPLSRAIGHFWEKENPLI